MSAIEGPNQRRNEALRRAPMTKSAAARELKISRRTVQRYAAKFPEIVLESGKIGMLGLIAAINQQKRGDARGFPLRGKRPLRQLQEKAERDKQIPPKFHRTLAQKYGLITSEIRSLSDSAKSLLLRDLLDFSAAEPIFSKELVIEVVDELGI